MPTRRPARCRHLRAAGGDRRRPPSRRRRQPRAPGDPAAHGLRRLHRLRVHARSRNVGFAVTACSSAIRRIAFDGDTSQHALGETARCAPARRRSRSQMRPGPGRRGCHGCRPARRSRVRCREGPALGPPRSCQPSLFAHETSPTAPGTRPESCRSEAPAGRSSVAKASPTLSGVQRRSNEWRSTDRRSILQKKPPNGPTAPFASPSFFRP